MCLVFVQFNLVCFAFYILQSTHIKDLESRLHQVASEAEATSKLKSQLEREKIELEGKVERLTTQLHDFQSRWVVAVL